MNKNKFFLLIAVVLILMGLPGSGFAQEETPIETELGDSKNQLGSIDYGLVDQNTVWLGLNQELYLSETFGETWTNITPESGLENPLISLSFPTAQLGFALYLAQSDSEITLELHKTVDRGKNWQEMDSALGKIIQEVLPAPISSVWMQWLDEQTGFVLVKTATSQNFSEGALFTTDNAGKDWQALQIPAAEEFWFVNRQEAFLTNPFTPNTFYHSLDGGRSWAEPPLNQEQKNESPLGLPFALPESGNFYFAKNGLEISLRQITSSEGVITLGSADLASPWFDEVEEDGMERDLTSLKTIGGNSLWASLTGGKCEESAGELDRTLLQCEMVWELWTSQDAGKSWLPVNLPDGNQRLGEQFTFNTYALGQAEGQNENQSDLENTNWVRVFKGHAFDACEIPALAKMATWYTASPFKAVNLYIGGISRACRNAALTAEYIRTLHRQGWLFIPTWVGPQAPCTTFRNKFSYDVNQAYQQGVDNANQAVAKLQDLNLTNANGSGSIVYLDVEYFPYSTQCSAAARSYVNGWTTRLAQLGNRSGLYATSGNISQNTFWTISRPPNAVWIAEWYTTPGFRANETVWNLRHLSNDVWISNQRILQYSGTFSGTWGGVTISIDPNVSEGQLAVPSGVDYIAPVTSIKLEGTAGYQGWYKTPVKVSLSANDFYTGVRQIYYKIGTGDWKPYTVPLTISQNGKTAFYYRSVDNAGNWETFKTKVIQIDTKPPILPTYFNPGCRAYSGVPQATCSDAYFTWSAAVDSGVGLSETDTYQYYWGTNCSGTGTTSTTYRAFDPAPIPARSRYCFRLRAQDRNGLWSAWKTMFVLYYDPSMTRHLWMPIMYKR